MDGYFHEKVMMLFAIPSDRSNQLKDTTTKLQRPAGWLGQTTTERYVYIRTGTYFSSFMYSLTPSVYLACA